MHLRTPFRQTTSLRSTSRIPSQSASRQKRSKCLPRSHGAPAGALRRKDGGCGEPEQAEKKERAVLLVRGQHVVATQALERDREGVEARQRRIGKLSRGQRPTRREEDVGALGDGAGAEDVEGDGCCAGHFGESVGG